MGMSGFSYEAPKCVAFWFNLFASSTGDSRKGFMMRESEYIYKKKKNIHESDVGEKNNIFIDLLTEPTSTTTNHDNGLVS